MTPDRFKTYARLSLGKVVEFPVPYLNITSKELEDGTVKEVVDSGLVPTADKFHTVASSVTVILGKPTMVYQLVAKSAEQFVEEFYVVPLTPYLGKTVLNATTVPESVINEMVAAVRDLGTLQLNRFAKSREYDSIDTLVTYKDDPDPTFAAEGARGIQLRSQYWSTLNAFRRKVMAGEIEFPRTAQGILQMFPDLTWE